MTRVYVSILEGKLAITMLQTHIELPFIHSLIKQGKLPFAVSESPPMHLLFLSTVDVPRDKPDDGGCDKNDGDHSSTPANPLLPFCLPFCLLLLPFCLLLLPFCLLLLPF